MRMALSWLLFLGGVANATQISPVPTPSKVEPVQVWTFDENADGWTAWNNCSLTTDSSVLKVLCTGNDPYLGRSVEVAGGNLMLTLKIRASAPGSGSVYWTTDRSPGFGEDKTRSFQLATEDKWQEVSVRFTADGTLRQLRIDPAQGAGDVEIDAIRLYRETFPPVRLERIELDEKAAQVTVKNHSPHQQAFTILGRPRTIDGGAELVVSQPLARTRPLEAVAIELRCPEFPPHKRTVFAYHDDVRADWIIRDTPHFRLRVAADGSVACVERDGKLAAVLAPLVHREGVVPDLTPAEDDQAIRLSGDGISVRILCAGKELALHIESADPCEGPVVRALGEMQRGLLAGLEYLGEGESSSSTLDIRTPDHLRFAPDPLHVTMPLMAFVTDRGTVALTWEEMALRPTFATPNFFDGSPDHRMALRGRNIKATILVDDCSLEESILWAVRRDGLPPVPSAPRTTEEQRELCLDALKGPLRTEDGWGHCVEGHWTRQPYADMASTVWRLSGEIPSLPNLVPGGAHLPNGSIYFVTGRAEQWLEYQRRQAESHRREQRPDGSFRYNGPYGEGHFEDTALGVCARPAVTMLEYARVAGDAQMLAAACRTLDYMKRFAVPRGAQVWEVPLHTPDQLAAAYAVWAYVRGYELTDRQDYLREARRWALSGVPFVYLWTCRPVMLYGTPPVYGATNWVAPVWIGLPVQWVGGVYGYALTMLAPYDNSLDWKHLAEGILVAAQQMQYPSGPNRGLLPDSWDLRSQERRPWNINPCALVSLQRALEGQVDFLSVASEGPHRVAAPFPVAIDDGKAIIHGEPALAYQVIVDGRVVDVNSDGEDIIPLE